MLQLTWVRVVSSLIFAVLAYDIAINDGFSKSQTYQYLKNAGVIGYGEVFYKITEKTSFWAEENYPFIYNQAVSVLKPYINLVYNLSLILSNVAFQLIQNTIKTLDTGAENSLLLFFGDTFNLAKTSLDMITVTLKNVLESATHYANNLLGS